ncbi:MAG: hypothetical protein HY550_03205, partial [Elusimicrobia bacterium]|nr:hypothetical protein [Elusimicrobiota bacterium]
AQLLRGTRLVASASPDPAGRFVIRYLLPGPYTLRVRDGGVWKSFDLKLASGQNLEIKPLGELLRKGAVYAYPNPAAAYVRFHLETEISPASKRLSIFSVDGTLVRAAEDGDPGWTSPAAGTYEYRWDFSGGGPASGVYFYSVKLRHGLSGETSVTTRKFAVIR